MMNDLSRNPETAGIPSAGDMELRNYTGDTASGLDQWLAKKLLKHIGNPPIALVLRDGTSIQTAGGIPRARLVIHDRAALLTLLVNPEYNFGELYTTGRIEVEGDLIELLSAIYRSLYSGAHSPWSRFGSEITRRLFSGSSQNAARRNIHHHYDIGNGFYKKWLDQEMQYTCAYFANPDSTLEQAQIAKMHHVCRKLMLKPDQVVVEAGCGWGGLARFMAREYGVRVKAYNISREQIAYARQRAHAEGLDEMVEYIEDDYRNIDGQFDAFVSVGMLEHVGVENYQELGSVINACLKETGTGLIHSIGFNHPDYLNPWIEKRIFPGACPPSISQMMDIFEPFDFSILDIENLRLHYARTLEQWLIRFNNHQKDISHDFDEEFVRAWHLYLSGSSCAFLTGSMQLFQVVFTRAHNNKLPWSRSHLYTDT